MKIFIARQKRKQAARTENENETKTEAEPNNLFRILHTRAYQRLVRPASPAPPTQLLEQCLALPIVYIELVTVADVGRNEPVFAPLLAVTFNLFARLCDVSKLKVFVELLAPKLV